ncbi:hypothetical protein [Shewanella sp. GXUN23E]|uniref:hypothetical protein n=1 Tax=Shewanella sp. GXUN23E TaxID=3422498 RepID=UPI003D7D624A
MKMAVRRATRDPASKTQSMLRVECHDEITGIAMDESKLAEPEAHPHKSIHFCQDAGSLACHAKQQKQGFAACQ